MPFRVKYNVVLRESGERMTGYVPINLDKSVKRKDREDAVHRIAQQVRQIYADCQTDSRFQGHIRLGYLQLDANNLTAFELVPQKKTIFGWRSLT